MKITKCWQNALSINMKFITKKSLKQNVRLSFHLLQAFDYKTKWIYGFTLISAVLIWIFLNVMRRKVSNTYVNFGIGKLAMMVISIQSSLSVPTRTKKALRNKTIGLSHVTQCHKTIFEKTKSKHIFFNKKFNFSFVCILFAF
jgi:hypothetical protein